MKYLGITRKMKIKIKIKTKNRGTETYFVNV